MNTQISINIPSSLSIITEAFIVRIAASPRDFKVRMKFSSNSKTESSSITMLKHKLSLEF